MPKVDVIILSDAKSEYHRALTEQAVNSCLASEKEDFFNIIVVENQAGITYTGASTANFEGEFNYNRFMNMGADIGDAEYICFCNNDLSFEKGWARELLSAVLNKGVNCASPYSRTALKHKVINPRGQVYIGHENGLNFAGWCFLMSREDWKKIGRLDEDFFFWCADNATIEQLTKAELKCALVTSSFVEHVGGGENTLSTIPKNEREPMTWAQVKLFNLKYSKNLFGIGT